MTTTNKVGMELIRDVFHRADVNDDDEITLDEFIDYFGDGVVSSSDLKSLFDDIDFDDDGLGGGAALPGASMFGDDAADDADELFSAVPKKKAKV